MSKLVDKERLAKLAKALDQRAKAAVLAEKTRAMGVESGLEGRIAANEGKIAAIENKDTGILAQAKNYADEQHLAMNNKINAKVDQSVYEAKVTELVNKDSEQAGLINGLSGKVAQLEEKMGDKDMAGIQGAIDEFKEAQLKIDEKQNQDIVAAKEAADAAQADVDAVEKRLDDEGGLVDRIEAVEEFVDGHSHAEIESDIQGLDGRIDQLEAFKNGHDHQPIINRIAALEEMHSEGGDVDQKIAAVQGDVDALEQAYTKFIGEQAAKDQGQDQLIAAKADKAAYETKVGELEDKDAELDQAIKDEAARAAGVEQGLQQAIDAINDAEDGIFAKAKELVDAEKDARVEADNALDERLQDIENSVGEGGALEARVAANEAMLAGLEKATVKAEIDQAEADAKAYADEKIADLVNSAPEAMNTLKELADEIAANEGIYNAYVAEHATAMAQQKTDLQKEIDDDIAAARTLISAEIDADVKAEADRAKLEEQDIRADFAAADAALKLELQGEIDADVKVEKERAEAQEAAIRQELASAIAQEVKDRDAAILVENQRAVQRENKIEEEYKAADSALDKRLINVENLLGGQGEGDALSFAEVVAKVGDLEAKDAELVAEDQRLAGEIAEKVDQGAYNTKVEALESEDERIAGLVQKAQDEVDAVEGRMDTAEGKITTLESFMNGHRHDVMEQGIADNKKGVASNKAAIEVLNGDATKEGSVAKSIADALKPYATEAETLAVIGQVVNSLALTMEGNKMVLKLGGVEGVTIHSTSLDMVTDADIDEIVAGLDEANPTNLF
jgi:chromosome segregation ATPase